jgi:hypothetical protein
MGLMVETAKWDHFIRYDTNSYRSAAVTASSDVQSRRSVVPEKRRSRSHRMTSDIGQFLLVLDFDSSGRLVTFSNTRGTNNTVVGYLPAPIDQDPKEKSVAKE